MLIANKLLIPAYKAIGSVGGTDTVINSKNATIKNSVYHMHFFIMLEKGKSLLVKAKRQVLLNT